GLEWNLGRVRQPAVGTRVAGLQIFQSAGLEIPCLSTIAVDRRIIRMHDETRILARAVARNTPFAVGDSRHAPEPTRPRSDRRSARPARRRPRVRNATQPAHPAGLAAHVTRRDDLRSLP